MKKILLLSAFLTLGLAANAFAAASSIVNSGGFVAADGGVILIGTLSIKPSANVTMAYNSAVVTVGVPISYTVGATHTSGTFLYATSSTDTNIFRSGVLTIKIPAAPTAATAGVTWTTDGWSASK